MRVDQQIKRRPIMYRKDYPTTSPPKEDHKRESYPSKFTSRYEWSRDKENEKEKEK